MNEVTKELIEKRMPKDEFGLYVNAPNYQNCRDRIIAHEKNVAKEKLERVPKWIRKLYNAL